MIYMFGGFLGRAAVGTIGGGAIGAMQGRDASGIAGSAALGGLAGGIGGHYMNKMGGSMRGMASSLPGGIKGSVSGLAGKAKGAWSGLGTGTKSAIAGGGIGYMSDGDLGGIAGGAAAGAAAGSFGLGYARKLAANRSVSSMARSGLGKAGKGATSAAARWDNRTISKAANVARSDMNTASEFIGKNSTWVNKYGGKALGAAGIGSSALIGSSLISSNRGY